MLLWQLSSWIIVEIMLYDRKLSSSCCWMDPDLRLLLFSTWVRIHSACLFVLYESYSSTISSGSAATLDGSLTPPGVDLFPATLPVWTLCRTWVWDSRCLNVTNSPFHMCINPDHQTTTGPTCCCSLWWSDAERSCRNVIDSQKYRTGVSTELTPLPQTFISWPPTSCCTMGRLQFAVK